MNPYSQIEPTSTAQLLTCMGLIIEETKLLRSIVSFKDMVGEAVTNETDLDKASYLSSEIAHLEEKLKEVRSQANRVQLT